MVTVPVIAFTIFSSTFENMSQFATPNIVAGIVFAFLSVVAALSSFALSLIVPIAIVRAANESRTGTPSSMEELYKYSGKHLWGYLWIAVIATFFTVTAAGFFIIPALIVNIYLALALMAYVIDGRRGMDALVWSAHAVRDNWWKVLGRLILLILTILASMILLKLIAEPFRIFLNATAWETLFVGLNVFLSNLFVVPFASIFSVLLYTELKKTKHAPSDLDQYRIRRNLWTMTGAGIIVGIALIVVGLRFAVPLIIQEVQATWPMPMGRIELK